MAIRGAGKRQSSTKNLNPRNAKRVAHGHPTAPETDSTGSESEQHDSQGFYHTIVVQLPGVLVKAEPKARPQPIPKPATVSRRVSTASGNPATGKRKLGAVPEGSHSSSALPATGTPHGRPAAKKAKVSREYTRTAPTRNRRRSTRSCIRGATPTRARTFNFSDISVAPVVDGGHADTSSPSSSYQSESGLESLPSISTRDRSTRSQQKNSLTPVVSSPLSWDQDISPSGSRLPPSPTNVPPRLNGLIRNTSLPRPLQKHTSAPPAPISARLSSVEEVSPPPAHARHSPTSGLNRSSRSNSSARLERGPVSWPLPAVPDVSSPLTNAYGLPSPHPNRSTRTVDTSSTTPSSQIVEVGSDGAEDADTSSSDSEDETKPEIDTEAMLKRLAVSNSTLAKLLTSGPRNSRLPQQRNGFVQDITGRMKKITEGSKYSWPEEKMPVKVNLVNRLARKAKRTMGDEEGRRVPGFFHSVSFEEKWEISGERDNIDIQSVKQLQGRGLGKGMKESVGNLEDSLMRKNGDSPDEVLDTIIARMPPPELPPTSRTANRTPASPRLSTPALSLNTSQASSIQGDPSPILASPVSNWSKAFYLPDCNIREVEGEQIPKDYPLRKGVDTYTEEAVAADDIAGPGVFVIQVMNLSNPLHGGGVLKEKCKAKIAEGDDTVLDKSEAMDAARVLHSLRL